MATRYDQDKTNAWIASLDCRTYNNELLNTAYQHTSLHCHKPQSKKFGHVVCIFFFRDNLSASSNGSYNVKYQIHNVKHLM